MVIGDLVFSSCVITTKCSYFCALSSILQTARDIASDLTDQKLMPDDPILQGKKSDVEVRVIRKCSKVASSQVVC